MSLKVLAECYRVLGEINFLIEDIYEVNSLLASRVGGWFLYLHAGSTTVI